MTRNPYQKYQQAKVTTANPAKLVLMLYDGAMRFMNTAVSALEEKDFKTAHANIVKAENIFLELISSLKVDAGPIAENLFRLYKFMNFRLVEANSEKNADKVREVIELMKPLRDSWAEMMKKTVKGTKVEMAGTSGEKKVSGRY